MRKLTLLTILLAALGGFAQAQNDHPRAELFGGYQFTHLNPNLDANGWNAAVTGNLNRWFGITADFSGAYKNGGHINTYAFGPTFSARTGRVTAFTHALFGGTCCDFAFMTALGGGLDVNAGNHLAVRLVQADWLLFHADGSTDKKNARISCGIVLRF
jgi:hypothetical protein